MYLAIDFDGTIAKHKYPDIGDPVPGAIEWLLQFKALGATLILWTMRSRESSDGDTLEEADAWCKSHGLEFDFLNEHPQTWTNSPKAYAHLYVDDCAFGCPLVEDKFFGRPYVDWNVVGPAILDMILDGR